ncbi:hypothetical protein JXA56_02515 [Candidatus Micrarchaeota archaeon]|nr:hypothetical protein [Candidatus Micrarchaeota archaeon]
MKRMAGTRLLKTVAASLFSFALVVPIHETRAGGKTECTLVGDGIIQKKSNGQKNEFYGIFRNGETAMEIQCKEQQIVILTDKALVVTKEARGGKDNKGMREEGSFTRYGLDDIYRRGLVSYVLDSTRAFFLTRDQTLTLLPYENGARGIRAFSYETNVSETKMAVEGSVLFLAPLGESMHYCSFSTSPECESVPLAKSDQKGLFFRYEGTLFFGRKEKKFKITAGESIESVKID